MGFTNFGNTGFQSGSTWSHCSRNRVTTPLTLGSNVSFVFVILILGLSTTVAVFLGENVVWAYKEQSSIPGGKKGNWRQRSMLPCPATPFGEERGTDETPHPLAKRGGDSYPEPSRLGLRRTKAGTSEDDEYSPSCPALFASDSDSEGTESVSFTKKNPRSFQKKHVETCLPGQKERKEHSTNKPPLRVQPPSETHESIAHRPPLQVEQPPE